MADAALLAAALRAGLLCVAPTPRPAYPGFFVTFEGMDGSGKGTQIDLLVKSLQSEGIEAVVNREPGGTIIGRQIRAILLDAANTHLQPTAELLLYFASRAQAVEEVILPALQSGKVVISDRFTDSTAVYQGAARGLGPDVVALLDAVSCQGLVPDLTILLDIDLDTSIARAAARNAESGSKETRLDEESRDFHAKVREGYLALAAAHPARIRIVNGNRRPPQIADELQALLRQSLAGRK
ncbi:MAG: dTMP kinase [Bryobacterales bacterium]|nr:dTMP kinase [Bryobacterales bacterium]